MRMSGVIAASGVFLVWALCAPAASALPITTLPRPTASLLQATTLQPPLLPPLPTLESIEDVPQHSEDVGWGNTLWGVKKVEATGVTTLALRDILIILVLVIVVLCLVSPLGLYRALLRRGNTRLLATIAAPGLQPIRVCLWQTKYCPRVLNVVAGHCSGPTYLKGFWVRFLYPRLQLCFEYLTVVSTLDAEQYCIPVRIFLTPWTALRVWRRLRRTGHVTSLHWEHDGTTYRVVPQSLAYDDPDVCQPPPPPDSLLAAGPIAWEPLPTMHLCR